MEQDGARSGASDWDAAVRGLDMTARLDISCCASRQGLAVPRGTCAPRSVQHGVQIDAHLAGGGLGP